MGSKQRQGLPAELVTNVNETSHYDDGFAPGFGLDFYAVTVNNDHICWDSPIISLCQGSMEKPMPFVVEIICPGTL